MKQTSALNQLRQRIIEELYAKQWREVWFFPEKDGIKGWRGTDPIMFIGLNPSTGRFPSKADHMFYQCLARNGFCNSHITDVFKVRSTPEDMRDNLSNKGLVRLHQRYLLEEIDLLNPHLLVALGYKTLNILKEWIPERFQTRLIRIRHYSWAKRYRKENVFSQDMAKVRRHFKKFVPNIS